MVGNKFLPQGNVSITQGVVIFQGDVIKIWVCILDIVSNETLWEENDINVLLLSAKDILRIEIDFIRIPSTIYMNTMRFTDQQLS